MRGGPIGAIADALATPAALRRACGELAARFRDGDRELDPADVDFVRTLIARLGAPYAATRGDLISGPALPLLSRCFVEDEACLATLAATLMQRNCVPSGERAVLGAARDAVRLVAAHLRSAAAPDAVCPALVKLLPALLSPNSGPLQQRGGYAEAFDRDTGSGAEWACARAWIAAHDAEGGGAAADAGASAAWRAALDFADWLDVLEPTEKMWRKAQIHEVSPDGKRLKVHFENAASSLDRWLPRASREIAPQDSRQQQKRNADDGASSIAEFEQARRVARRWRQRLVLGDRVDAMASNGRWSIATVDATRLKLTDRSGRVTYTDAYFRSSARGEIASVAAAASSAAALGLGGAGGSGARHCAEQRELGETPGGRCELEVQTQADNAYIVSRWTNAADRSLAPLLSRSAPSARLGLGGGGSRETVDAEALALLAAAERAASGEQEGGEAAAAPSTRTDVDAGGGTTGGAAGGARFAARRPSRPEWGSPALVDLVNSFGAEGGFGAIIRLVSPGSAGAGGSNASSGGAPLPPPLTSPSSLDAVSARGVVEHATRCAHTACTALRPPSLFSLDVLRALVACLASSHALWTRAHARAFVLPFRAALLSHTLAVVQRECAARHQHYFAGVDAAAEAAPAATHGLRASSAGDETPLGGGHFRGLSTESVGEALEAIVSGCEPLMVRVLGHARTADELEQFTLTAALRLFVADPFAMRLCGMRFLVNAARLCRDEAAGNGAANGAALANEPDGAARPLDSVDSVDSVDGAPYVMWLRRATFLRWLKSSRIVAILLDPHRSTHIELLKRSDALFRLVLNAEDSDIFSASGKDISAIDLLWDALLRQNANGRVDMYSLIGGLVDAMQAHHLGALLERIRSLPPPEVTAEVLALVSKFAVRAHKEAKRYRRAFGMAASRAASGATPSTAVYGASKRGDAVSGDDEQLATVTNPLYAGAADGAGNGGGAGEFEDAASFQSTASENPPAPRAVKRSFSANATCDSAQELHAKARKWLATLGSNSGARTTSPVNGMAQYGPRRNAVGSVVGARTRAESTMSADELRAEWGGNDAICRAALDLLSDLSLDAERNGLGDEVAALALAHLESLLTQRLKRPYTTASSVALLGEGLAAAWVPLPSVVGRQNEARWKWVARCAACVRERSSVEQALKLMCAVIATYPRIASLGAIAVAVEIPAAQAVAVSASIALPLPLAAAVVDPAESAPAPPLNAGGDAHPHGDEAQIPALPECRADAVARLFALREGASGGSVDDQTQPCFLDDLFAELRSYKRRAAQRWAATARGGTSKVVAEDDAQYGVALCGGRHSHLISVKVRLAVLSRLIAFARPSRAALSAPGARGVATLSRKHIEAVWDELVEGALTEAERDAALMWVRRCCRQSRVSSGGGGGGSTGSSADVQGHGSEKTRSGAADVAFAQSLWSGVDDDDTSSTELSSGGATKSLSLSVGDMKGHREVFNSWLSAALRGERTSGAARGGGATLATDPGVLPDIFRSRCVVKFERVDGSGDDGCGGGRVSLCGTSVSELSPDAFKCVCDLFLETNACATADRIRFAASRGEVEAGVGVGAALEATPGGGSAAVADAEAAVVAAQHSVAVALGDTPGAAAVAAAALPVAVAVPIDSLPALKREGAMELACAPGDLEGVDMLWRIALDAERKQTVKAAILFINKLYSTPCTLRKEGDDSSGAGMRGTAPTSHAAQVRRCLRELHSAVVMLEKGAAAEDAAGAARRSRRCVLMLNSLVDVSDGAIVVDMAFPLGVPMSATHAEFRSISRAARTASVSLQPHAARLRGQQTTVRVTHNLLRCALKSPAKFIVRDSMSWCEFRALVARSADIHFDQMRMIGAGKEIAATRNMETVATFLGMRSGSGSASGSASGSGRSSADASGADESPPAAAALTVCISRRNAPESERKGRLLCADLGEDCAHLCVLRAPAVAVLRHIFLTLAADVHDHDDGDGGAELRSFLTMEGCKKFFALCGVVDDGARVRDIWSKYATSFAPRVAASGVTAGEDEGWGAGAASSSSASVDVETKRPHTLPPVVRLEDRLMALDGFMYFYRDAAATRAVKVWSDLRKCGFGNDLRPYAMSTKVFPWPHDFPIENPTAELERTLAEDEVRASAWVAAAAADAGDDFAAADKASREAPREALRERSVRALLAQSAGAEELDIYCILLRLQRAHDRFPGAAAPRAVTKQRSDSRLAADLLDRLPTASTFLKAVKCGDWLWMGVSATECPHTLLYYLQVAEALADTHAPIVVIPCRAGGAERSSYAAGAQAEAGAAASKVNAPGAPGTVLATDADEIARDVDAAWAWRRHFVSSGGFAKLCAVLMGSALTDEASTESSGGAASESLALVLQLASDILQAAVGGSRRGSGSGAEESVGAEDIGSRSFGLELSAAVINCVDFPTLQRRLLSLISLLAFGASLEGRAAAAAEEETPRAQPRALELARAGATRSESQRALLRGSLALWVAIRRQAHAKLSAHFFALDRSEGGALGRFAIAMLLHPSRPVRAAFARTLSELCGVEASAAAAMEAGADLEAAAEAAVQGGDAAASGASGAFSKWLLELLLAHVQGGASAAGGGANLACAELFGVLGDVASAHLVRVGAPDATIGGVVRTLVAEVRSRPCREVEQQSGGPEEDGNAAEAQTDSTLCGLLGALTALVTADAACGGAVAALLSDPLSAESCIVETLMSQCLFAASSVRAQRRDGLCAASVDRALVWLRQNVPSLVEEEDAVGGARAALLERRIEAALNSDCDRDRDRDRDSSASALASASPRVVVVTAGEVKEALARWRSAREQSALLPRTFQEALVPTFPKCKSEPSRVQAYALLHALCSAGDADAAARAIAQVVCGGACFRGLLSLQRDSHLPAVRGWDTTLASKASTKRVSKTGYVGIRNLGCVCYLSSMLQQLYMVPRFRAAILDVDVDVAAAAGAAASAEAGATAGMAARIDPLPELQKLFARLALSSRQDVDPAEWCKSFGVRDVNEQRDTEEFLNNLHDKLETSLASTPHRDLLKELFGGTHVQQLIGIDPRSGERFVREKESPFVHLGIEVSVFYLPLHFVRILLTI